MGRILAADVAAVREQVPLDKVVSESVNLRAAGLSTWKGLCPFHDERTPSLHVNPDKGFWYCFGCSEGGDAIDFVQRVENLSFVEAVEKLADLVGVQLRYEEGGPSAAEYARRKQLLRLIEDTQRLYLDTFAALPEHHPARQFFTDRHLNGVTDQFGIGYAPERGATLRHLASLGWTTEDQIDAGVCTERGGQVRDLFGGRITWPIRDPAGKIVSFGGRALTSSAPKYVNGPETALYRKSSTLFNLHAARRHINDDTIIVVEGYTDVMAFTAAGIGAVVATCGTAFGAEHVTALRRTVDVGDSAGPVAVFVFDGDNAGRAAALRAFALEPRFTRQTYVAIPPDGCDPCELWATSGAEALRDLAIRDRVALAEYALGNAIEGYDTSTVEGRLDALDAAVPVLASIRDDMVRASYETWLSGRVGVEAWRIAKQVRIYSHRSGTDTSAGKEAANPDREAATSGMPDVEREALKCVLQQPALSASWYEAVEPEAYTTPAGGAVHAAVAAQVTAADAGSRAWLDRVAEASGQHALVAELVMEPLMFAGQPDEVGDHCDASMRHLIEADARRRISRLRAELSALTPGDARFDDVYRSLLQLEQHRRELLHPTG